MILNSVRDFIGRDICYDCLECGLADHSIVSPGGLIYEDDFIIVHPHLLVKLKGFIVVSPKRHVTSMYELTNDELFSVGEAIERIKKAFIINQISDDVTVQYVEKENSHFEVWVVAKLHPLLEKDIDLKYFASDLAMQYRNITPSEPIEILYTTQILKTYFKAKKFIETSGQY